MVSWVSVWVLLGSVLSVYLVKKLRGERFVPQMVLMGARGVGKTRLFCAISYGMIPRTLPSLESERCDATIPITESRAIIHEFHSSVTLWPRDAFKVLYKSLLNVLVVSDEDSLNYLKIVLARYPFVRKGLTICCTGDLSKDIILSRISATLEAFGIKKAKIENELRNIRVVFCSIQEDRADLDELATLVFSIL